MSLERDRKDYEMCLCRYFLPSGVNTGDFTTRVREEGAELDLTVKWPIPLNDVEMLHQKWLTSAYGRM